MSLIFPNLLQAEKVEFVCNKAFILHTVGKIKCNVGREMLFIWTDYITVSQYTVTP